MRHASPSQMNVKPAQGGVGTTRLRTRVFIGAVLIALVPLAVFVGLWLRSEYDKSRREIEGLVAARASALLQRLEAEVQGELVMLQALAAMPVLDEPDPPAFQALADRLVAVVPQWSALGLIDAASGRPVSSTQQRPGGAPAPDLAAPDAIRRAVETRKPVILTPPAEPGGADRAPGRTVLLGMPVVRDNAVRFVLVAGMKAKTLQQVVDQSAEPGFVALVADERGADLARSRGSEPFVGALAGRTQADQAAGLLLVNAADNRQAPAAFRRSALTGWTALVASDRTPLEAMSARSTWATVGAGAASLGLAAVLAVFLFYNVMERRVGDERLAASRALSDLDARLLAATQESLAEQRKAASERDVLMREIYHRVKNNLQIVQSLLRLGSRDLKPDQREPFESAIRRIGAMARVHTLLYNSPDLASIDLKDYLEGLLREASDAFGAEERGIQTVLDAASMRVPLDTAVPLAFVAVELLTNAFKHAFPEGRTGVVTITAARDDGAGILTIADNGVGLPAESVGRRSLGLTIVSKLVDQIGGAVEPPPPGESVFRVRFPLESGEAA